MRPKRCGATAIVAESSREFASETGTASRARYRYLPRGSTSHRLLSTFGQERFICNCGGFLRTLGTRSRTDVGSWVAGGGWREEGRERGRALMRLRSLSDVASTSCAVTSTRSFVIAPTSSRGLHDLLPPFPFSRPTFPAVDFFVTIRACDMRPHKMNVFARRARVRARIYVKTRARHNHWQLIQTPRLSCQPPLILMINHSDLFMLPLKTEGFYSFNSISKPITVYHRTVYIIIYIIIYTAFDGYL